VHKYFVNKIFPFYHFGNESKLAVLATLALIVPPQQQHL